MKEQYILALDQGTSSSRAIVFDHDGRIRATAQKEFTQHFPRPGWVEHDPREIWSSEASVIAEAISGMGINGLDIAAIGITNQRETTMVWDAATGEPIYNAIVWQDRRTSEYCDSLKAEGLTDMIRQKTGLLIDAYFSATKIRWILENVPGAREKARKGELRFGTVDTWLIWNLTRGEVHVTDVSNASRTMLFNINDLQWDEELLRLMDIPLSMMPQVKSSSEVYGYTKTTIFAHEVPIAGIAGDQQAALFGQMCTEPGSVKNTYGTGCFMLMNTGDTPVQSRNGLLTTMAWRIGGKPVFALEGSVFMGGATIQWLRDELKIISHAAESEALAQSINSTGGVYLVPAFTGLGAPWWDMYSRGTLIGMTRGTGRPQIVRAALEAIAFQSADLMDAMAKDCGQKPDRLQVDGGASANAFLMQFQADISAIPVVRPKVLETTALGAALLAGLGVGMYSSLAETAAVWQKDLEFTPKMDEATRLMELGGWHKAVERSLGFAK